MIDISMPLDDATPAFPGDPRFERRTVADTPRVSRLVMSAHSGTHVDAPLHFIPGGPPIDAIPLETFVGPCVIASGGVPRAERVLYQAASLSPELAREIVIRGVKLVGIASLSVDPLDSTEFPAHRILLAAGVVIVEGLVLHHVEPGEYRLIVAPLALRGAEAAPARAFIERMP